jgi:hypothetical protein
MVDAGGATVSAVAVAYQQAASNPTTRNGWITHYSIEAKQTKQSKKEPGFVGTIMF